MVPGKLLKWGRKPAHIVSNGIRRMYSDDSDIFDLEWDNLIILDACRHDIFEEVLGESVPSRISEGSSSREFMRQNFVDGQYHDTVYISANPWALEEIPEGTFYSMDFLWDSAWDDGLQTVPPEDVVSAAKTAFGKHPNKRFIIHFMQPHIPFIDESGRIFSETDGMERARARQQEEKTNAKNAWDLFREGKISQEEMLSGYKRSLEFVLPYTQELADSLGGQTVVTSDHGNLFGEWAWPFPIRLTAHPNNIWTPKLVKVPYHIISDGKREIQVDRPLERSQDENSASEKLKALGYV